MKIGERKKLKPIEVTFLLVILGVMMVGLYHYRDLFIKKSANMFDEVMKNTMDQAKKLGSGDLIETVREVITQEKKKEPETTEDSSVKDEPEKEADDKGEHEKKWADVRKSNSFVRGIEYINQGDDQKARECLAQAIADQQEAPEPHFWMGVSYLNTNQPQQAIPELEQAIKLSPENVEYLMNLGMAYFQSGDKEKSKEVLVKAQRIAPDNRLVQETLEWIR